MPWEKKEVSQMREEFVRRVHSGEKTKAALCREYGISRPTGDKWIKRYEAGETLEDKSRRPKRIQRTDEETEQIIIKYRQAHPAIGAAKIHRILTNQGIQGLPSPKTCNNILKRNGLILPAASEAATPYKRFEKAYPNQMWQADYKGWIKMNNGLRNHPLNIIDDYSRFSLCCRAMRGETFEEIKPVMIDLFKTYGLPFSLLCDNGPPWGTSQSTGYTHFEVWLMELGVLTLHGRALHPQTQGKGERFNGTLTRELLKHTVLEDFEDSNRQFEEYRQFYNTERPHHALDMDTPAEHYTRSEREYTDKIAVWEYPENCQLRKVKSSGYFSWNNQGYFLSEAFADKEIAIRPSKIPGCVSLFFRQFRIGRIDVEKRVFTFKRAYLIQGDPRWTDT